MDRQLIHTCTFTSSRVGEFRDKHMLKGKTNYGTGLTVWEHKCSCGTTLFSVSQWQFPPSAGGVSEEYVKGLKVRTPGKNPYDTPLAEAKPQARAKRKR
jgi:hypothetical protein